MPVEASGLAKTTHCTTMPNSCKWRGAKRFEPSCHGSEADWLAVDLFD